MSGSQRKLAAIDRDRLSRSASIDRVETIVAVFARPTPSSVAPGKGAETTTVRVAINGFGRATSKDEVNAAIKRAADQQLRRILGYTNDPNVSVDFNHDPHSSVFHMDQTKVMDGTLVRVMSWYDNEWGFSCRMADTAVAMGKLI